MSQPNDDEKDLPTDPNWNSNTVRIGQKSE